MCVKARSLGKERNSVVKRWVGKKNDDFDNTYLMKTNAFHEKM